MQRQGKKQKADAFPHRRSSPPGRSCGDISDGLFREGEEAHFLKGTEMMDENSLSSEAAAFSSDQKREHSSFSMLGEEEDETVTESKLTTSRELGFVGAVAGKPIVAEYQNEAAMAADSPASIGKLHMALESLIKPIAEDTRLKGGNLNAMRCSAFCKEWMEGNLPTFLDPSLLQSVWLAADQVTLWVSRRCSWKEFIWRG